MPRPVSSLSTLSDARISYESSSRMETCQGKLIKCHNCNGLGHIAWNCTQPKRPRNFDYFKDKMLLMQAQENGAVLDEEELLFLSDECDAFDSDVDDEPTAQSIFMASLSSAGPVNLQAGPSNASILSEVHDLDNAIDPSNNDQNNKIIEETVTALKQEFKQKETKFLIDFSNMKNLKDKLENKLYSQDQSIQSVHMMLKPTKLYDQDVVTAIGVQNPFYLRKAKNAQPALYDGDELLKTHQVPVIVTSFEEDLELAESTRIKMTEKMNDPVCVEKRVKIIPPNYSKENFIATFTPQTQLTPEQVFWSNEIKEKKVEDLKARTSTLPVLPPATVYPPNTPVHLVPRTLPTTSQVNIGLYVITQLFWDFEKTCKKQITPTGITEEERGFEQTKRCYLTEVIPFFNLLKEHFDEVQKSLVKEVRAMKVVFENLEAEVDQNAIAIKSGKIERKNLLITNETLIANCIAQDVFYTVTDSVMNASRFHKLSTTYNVAMNHAVDLEAGNSKLLEKIQNDDHNTMVKDFSKLEIAHLNLQLKHQHLKENLENFKSKSSNVPEFDAFFELGKRDDQIQETVTALQERLENFKAENEKVKQQYQELFNSIKITRVKTIEKTTSLQTEIENLKTRLKGKRPCVTTTVETPKVFVLEKYAIDVHPLPQPQRNNRGIHHGYLNRLRDTLDTLCEIVEEARSNRPSDKSLEYACIYTKHSHELLEYMNASFLKADNKRDKFIATTPLTRKKHVTFADPLETSGNNTPKHVKQQSVHQTNVPIILSTGVSTATTARRCTMNTTPKVLPVKQWKPTGRLILLGGLTPTAIGDPNFQTLHCRLCSNTGRTDRPLVFGLRLLKTYDWRSLTAQKFHEKVYQDCQIRKRSFWCNYGLWRLLAFRKHTCFVIDLDGVDLIKGSRGTNLYTISIEDTMRSSPIFFLSKASKNKSWLWHRCLNHLNFGTLNDLSRKDIVRGLPRLKFEKDHLCSACQLGKSKKTTHKPKMVNTIIEVLHTLQMDLCEPIRVQNINGKKYILVIVDDYSRFTWVKFLRSKDETLEFVVNLLKQLHVGLNKTVRNVRTEAIATAYYTQNRSLIHTLHNKTPYKLVHDKKPDLSFLRIFGVLCYPTNDSEDLGKLKAKVDIGSGPIPNLLTPRPISSELVPNPTHAAPYVPPTYKELEILFQPMFDEYFEPPTVDRLVPPVPTSQVPVNPSVPSVMQEEIHEFDRLQVWELGPPPDFAMIIALKRIYTR
ncbi:retrovirus-related pol polyprotein from transposon TNT 1-94 [Tanacetum coccineum]